MESMGLLSFDMTTVMTIDSRKDDNPALIFYNGEPNYLYNADRECVNKLYVFAMTSLGNCLAPIAGSARNEEYYLESIDAITKAGLHISDKPPRTP